ncbi:MAG: amino acid permease [Gammaproteobacteria bacterium]|nr:amino acid permease [Gammaproteobacteria bacterium]
MFAIVSVDSLRNIPIGAQYGFSLITFYLFAGLCFFLPLTWITSQLAVRFPNVGGSYLWIEAAFGKSFGRLSLWLQWTYNIIWYPTIFAFISSTLLSLIRPDFENNKYVILFICVSLFWLITFIHAYGIKASSWISTVSAILGTLLPMSVMIGFAAYWLLSGLPSTTPLGIRDLLPQTTDLHNIAYFSNILFSLMGLEVIAMHAGNVSQPQKTYPRALLIASLTILATLTLSSLALCIVISPQHIRLLNGIMDVFTLFFDHYQIPYGAQLMGWCVVIGAFGIASSWMIGLARGLHIALTSTDAPQLLQKLNKKGAPLNILCFQGIIYTLLLSAFLLLPSISSSYWFLSVLSAQFALLYYILLFSAAIKLFFSVKQTRAHAFLGATLPFIAGCVSLIGIVVGFVPPSNIGLTHLLGYELFLIGCLFLFCLPPFFLLRKK